MTKMAIYLLALNTVFFSVAQAQPSGSNSHAFMTARDILEEQTSNITLTNRTNQSIMSAGLFIASFDVNDCSACSGNIVGGDNVGGAVISRVNFLPNQAVPVGQNFLYNMLYNGIYYIKNTAGSSPCSLPGCTWPGDDPNIRGWCITINAISKNSSYTYSNYQNGSHPSAQAPAYAAAGDSPPSQFDYQYDLIDPSTLGVSNACLGPVKCDDKSLTCKVSTLQNENIEPY